MEKKNERHQSMGNEDLSEGQKNALRNTNMAPAFPDMPQPVPSTRRIVGKKKLDVQGVLDELEGYHERFTEIQDKKMTQAETSKILQS